MGQPFPEPQYINRSFAALVGRLGLPRIRPHDLRHTAATNMIRRGVPITTIAKILGHHDASVTLRIYARVIDEMQQDAIDQTDAMNGAAVGT